MRKLFILITIVIASITLTNAQYYTGINYQGYFLNYEFSGEQTLRITLLKDSQNGPVIYMEEYFVTVLNGLFNVVIGQGNPQGSYNFGEIEWNRHTAVFCKVEWVRFGQDKLLSVSQMMSVPFALYAENAGRMVDTIITINTIPSWPLHIDIPKMDFIPSKMHIAFKIFSGDTNNTFNGSLKYYDSNRDGNAVIMDRYNDEYGIESIYNQPGSEKFFFDLDGSKMLFDVSIGQITININWPAGTGTDISGIKLHIVAEY